MRGKGARYAIGLEYFGITPAYAGKSICTKIWKERRWDHPRICGEKLYAMKPARAGKGSPPHMRGKDVPCINHETGEGITPAYAGKSSFVTSGLTKSGDHPRICGEKTGGRLSAIRDKGSPPHMRGKDLSQPIQRGDQGITPAYAGKRSIGTSSGAAAPDHPRICGEKTKKIP